jgi:two-component system cell cycle response regulator DivK
LIEDSKEILFLMKMELEAFGYSVLTAKDGESGIEIAKRERPDVIISDIRMPGISGFEMMRRLRAIPELRSIPCIALTGYSTEQDVQEGLAAGYNAYISKPADPDDLVALIQKLTSA